MRTLVTGAIALTISGATAYAEAYGDQPTAEWFKTLSSVFEPHCCDQADCKRTASAYRNGSWWALSNRTGEWVKIVEVQVTASVSIFKDGVLCEGDPIALKSGYAAKVYCFSPPPLGF
jgi:hypothetical protein